MTRGEEVKVLVDYDLFDTNIKGETGVYLKTSSTTKKYLVYFSVNDEWAELSEEQVERVNPGKVSSANKQIVSSIDTMVTTYDA